ERRQAGPGGADRDRDARRQHRPDGQHRQADVHRACTCKRTSSQWAGYGFPHRQNPAGRIAPAAADGEGADRDEFGAQRRSKEEMRAVEPVAAVEAEGLVKTYSSRAGTVEAVRGVDLRVDSGEMFGFLGPNGAGKSTTVKMLTTLLTLTGGSA